MDRVNPIVQGNRDDDGHDDHKRRIDIHETTYNQEENIQGNQKDPFGCNMRLDDLKQLHGDFGVDHVRGQGQGRSDDDEDRPHKDHALPDDCGHLTYGNVAVDKDLYDEGISNDDGGHLSQCHKPAEDSHHEKQRNEKFPFGDARRRHDLPKGDFCPDGLCFPGDITTV